MKHRLIVLSVFLSGVASIRAQTYEFSRYQIILQQKPFGAIEAPEPETTSVVDKPAPPFIKDLKMVAITDSDLGIRVGIVNVATKPKPTSYYLAIGDIQDGIELVDADYEEEGALLKKDAEEYWIYMSGRLSASGVAASATEQEATGNTPARMTQNKMSYAARLRDRLKMTRTKPLDPNRPRLSPEEMKKHLEQYQMQAIREGMPPLPIPLTKEMDDQLVKEGVLPAQQ